MGLDYEDIDGQTPLNEDEKDGLRIPTIATRGELDEFEQQNIEEAVQWSMGRGLKPEIVFTEAFIRSLHRRMYGNGRHSRLLADIVIEKIFRLPVYTWGAGSLVKPGDQRAAYLKVIKAADAGDIQPLIAFARS